MAVYRPPRLTLPLTEPYLSIACTAWEQGGCLILGLWAARHLKNWGAPVYGQLVDQVRRATGDETDYSQEGAPT